MTRDKVEQANVLFKRLDHLTETREGLKTLSTQKVKGHAPMIRFVSTKPDKTEQTLNFHPHMDDFVASIMGQIDVIDLSITLVHKQLGELGVTP